jgi:hypothetical protein
MRKAMSATAPTASAAMDILGVVAGTTLQAQAATLAGNAVDDSTDEREIP